MPDDRIASQARAAASGFEAKKDGLRQTQAGEWKLTLTVLDLPAWLMSARMGTRLMAALVELADDETPIAHDVPAPNARPQETERSLSAGAALAREPKSDAARERFKMLGEPEQMVAKCAMLCGDRQFRLWLHKGSLDGGYFDTAEEAAGEVRRRCGIRSRSQLASAPDAAERWKRMLTDYDVWRGALPEPH